MRVGIPTAWALVIAFTGASHAQPCPDGDAGVVPVTVRVNMSPPTVEVDRESVTIFRKPVAGQARRVCWRVEGMPSTVELRIEPKDETAVDPFPILIRSLRAGRTFANSGNPTHETTWRYGLRLVDAEGETLAFLDPEVIVRGQGG